MTSKKNRHMQPLKTWPRPRCRKIFSGRRPARTLLLIKCIRKKFLPKTWEVLKASKLAVPGRGEFDDWLMTRNVGLAVMSILADACAGSQKRTVTDQSRSYNLLARSIAHIHGGEYGEVSQ